MWRGSHHQHRGESKATEETHLFFTLIILKYIYLLKLVRVGASRYRVNLLIGLTDTLKINFGSWNNAKLYFLPF